jgi:hypothetical protein
MAVCVCVVCGCSPDLPEIWEEMDTTLAVTEGRVARPVCVVPTATISAILYPVYGALEQGCNATTSYRCSAGVRSAAASSRKGQALDAMQSWIIGWLGGMPGIPGLLLPAPAGPNPDAPHNTAACPPPACSIVAPACLALSECRIFASNGVFGDPCPGIYKTLTFTYR